MSLRSPNIQGCAGVHPAIVMLFSLTFCNGCQPALDDQPRADVMEPRASMPLNDASRTPVPGTIARGQIWQSNAETTGKGDGELVARIPIDVTSSLIERGQKRFDIYCQHCHGLTGMGDGMVVQRGFPKPPSYHIERLRSAPDGHLFQVITEGLGRMPAFGARVPPVDRWAIVVYVRALQLSQNVSAEELQPQARQALTTNSEG